MLTLNVMSVVQKQFFFFDQQKLKNMSSVVPLTFNAVDLCFVTINEKPWAHAKELCRALEYGKATKTADIVKHLCNNEH